MKHSEMGGACRTYIGEERLWWRNFRERNHLEELDLDGRKMLKWTFKK
jgi:hypothetical protein